MSRDCGEGDQGVGFIEGRDLKGRGFEDVELVEGFGVVEVRAASRGGYVGGLGRRGSGNSFYLRFTLSAESRNFEFAPP